MPRSYKLFSWSVVAEILARYDELPTWDDGFTESGDSFTSVFRGLPGVRQVHATAMAPFSRSNNSWPFHWRYFDANVDGDSLVVVEIGDRNYSAVAFDINEARRGGPLQLYAWLGNRVFRERPRADDLRLSMRYHQSDTISGVRVGEHFQMPGLASDYGHRRQDGSVSVVKPWTSLSRGMPISDGPTGIPAYARERDGLPAEGAEAHSPCGRWSDGNNMLGYHVGVSHSARILPDGTLLDGEVYVLDQRSQSSEYYTFDPAADPPSLRGARGTSELLKASINPTTRGASLGAAGALAALAISSLRNR